MSKSKKDQIILNQGKGEVALDYNELKRAVMVLRAVNHPLRKKIIALLEKYSKLKVTDIYIKLRLEQSVASQHLSILRKAGIVVSSREGKFILYQLDEMRLGQIARLIEDLAG